MNLCDDICRSGYQVQQKCIETSVWMAEIRFLLILPMFGCFVSFRFGSDSENAQEKSDEELEPLSMKEVVDPPAGGGLIGQWSKHTVPPAPARNVSLKKGDHFIVNQRVYQVHQTFCEMHQLTSRTVL